MFNENQMAEAAMTNILRNPSFEDGWTDYNESIQLPNHWSVWWADASIPNPYDPAEHSKFVAPEIVHKLRSQIPENEQPLFFIDGDVTLKIFKQHGSFAVSLSQTLNLEPGYYRITAIVFPDVIERYDGSTKVTAPDPNSALVTFGVNQQFLKWRTMQPFLQLNSYSHEFAAEGYTRIDVCFMCPFPLANSGLFCDGWSLVKIPAPIEPIEPTDPINCIPLREPIELVSFLVNPSEDLADMLSRIANVWPLFRWSLFGSADHASVGCGAKCKTVIATNPSVWGSAPTLLEWLSEYYPDVQLLEVNYKNTFQLIGRAMSAGLKARGMTLAYPTTHVPHAVTDEFGSVRDYGHHEGLDLRSSYSRYGDKILAAIGGEVIIAGENPSEPWYGWQVRTKTPCLGDHWLWARYAHMVPDSIPVSLGQYVQAGDVLGHADNTGQSTGDHLHVDLRITGPRVPSTIRLYADPEPLIVFPDEEPPPEPPPPPPAGEFLSLHRQSGMDGLLQYVERVKPRSLKLVSEMEAAKEIKAISPNARIVYRHVNNDHEPFYADPNVAAAVNRWLAQFWEGIEINAQWIDAIEGLNEEIPTNFPDKLYKVVRFEAALSDEVARRNIGVGAVIVNAAVGNPGHNEVVLLLPAAEAAVRNGHWIGYHNYFPCHPDHAEIWMEYEGKHHHLRALLSWDPVFADRGLRPRYLFTESGAIGAYVREDGTPSGYVSAGSGWRTPECLDGDWPRYRNLLLQMRSLVESWNAQHDYRAEGAMIFTVYASGWEGFQLRKEELLSLADALTV